MTSPSHAATASIAASQPAAPPNSYAATVAYQNAAADPATSVWLAASAGTGKTEVLSKRLLRLLLQPGVRPEHILCLTYTQAAAGNMANRLAVRLTQWVTMPRQELFQALHDIGMTAPSESDVDNARRLFAAVLDSVGGLRIQTIHSFCQELLQRFPLEAGLMPRFKVLDDQQAKQLQQQALQQLLQQTESGQRPALTAAFSHVLQSLGESTVRDTLQQGYTAHTSVSHRADLAAILGCDAAVTTSMALEAACRIPVEFMPDLQAAAAAWQGAAKPVYVTRGQRLAAFLAATPDRRALGWDDYKDLFLTQKNQPRVRAGFAEKDFFAKHPCMEVLLAEGARVLAAQEKLRLYQLLQLNDGYHQLAAAFRQFYSQLKLQQGALDYDDLISRTANLLQAENAAWVRYKLDYDLLHILVDEAQDTGPAQWHILRALADEFVQPYSSGPLDTPQTRTLFVVGDEKQSIFSFNGADPAMFLGEAARYQQLFHTHQQPFQQLPLVLSFRSTQAVLDVVNSTFAQHPHLQVQQSAARSAGAAAGAVCLWPLLATNTAGAAGQNDADVEDTDDNADSNSGRADGWVLPLAPLPQPAASLQLARRIAAQIRAWLDSGYTLPDRNRPLDAGDIMILVQQRQPLMPAIVRALKELAIPVAGVDKIVLRQQLAVQDVLAALQFVLLPEDDLNLACLLKSPLCGLSEEHLFTLCHGRPADLWAQVRQQHPAIAAYLQSLQEVAQRQPRPYEFVQHILRAPCASTTTDKAQTGLQALRQRLGDEVMDTLAELLRLALHYESENTPSLQKFLLCLQQQDLEAKRELSEATGAVRVMTAHAAKGLQAPVVFLADAHRLPRKNDNKFIALDAVTLLVPKKEWHVPPTAAAAARLQAARQAEYDRLLYVAMTRAEDVLIVTGLADTKNAAPAESWYAQVRDGMQRLDSQPDAHGIVTYATGTRTGSRDQQTVPAATAMPLPPPWLYENAAAEATPARPLAPSQEMTPAVVSTSPLAAKTAPDLQRRFAAGVLTHRLLEVLPACPPAARAATLQRLLTAFSAEVPPARLQQIASEVQAILNHPEFAPLFGPDSRAEVPLVGMVDDIVISGQVDRLLVTATDVLVVDYKTNRPPPTTPAAVDTAYRVQLRRYVQVLQHIYPRHRVHAALLWTDGPRLMPMPPALLGL